MKAGVEVTVVDPRGGAADVELGRFFESCGESFAQQTPGWCKVIDSMGVDEPSVLVCRDGAEIIGALPAYRFEGPLGAILISCAQAGPLGGVACRDSTQREAIYAALIRAFRALAADRGCALATLITNPLWPDRDLCADLLEPDFELENVCQVLDLEEAVDAEGNFVKSSANLRRNLKKALAADLFMDEAQSAANVAEWYAIHVERHQKIGATPLPKGLFTGALAHMVPVGKARFFFVRRATDGEMVAGSLNLHHGRVMDALMPSVRHQYASLGGNYLLAAHAIRWAKAQGIHYYNWQPSPPDGGVHRFKRQWGSRDVPYAYLTKITGDASALLEGSVEAVRKGYPWHYVVPYDRIGSRRPEGGVSTRRDAWTAGDA